MKKKNWLTMRILKLYLIALFGYLIYRKKYRYPISILALKRINYIMSKYWLYRIVQL